MREAGKPVSAGDVTKALKEKTSFGLIFGILFTREAAGPAAFLSRRSATGRSGTFAVKAKVGKENRPRGFQGAAPLIKERWRGPSSLVYIMLCISLLKDYLYVCVLPGTL